jgi:membrane protease subunit HflC
MAKKAVTRTILAVVSVLVLIALFNAIYFVYEDEFAVITRFDRVVHVEPNPGIGFKIPFVDNKISLTKRLTTYDLFPSEVITRDKKNMIVDTYAVWRIDQPLRFLQTVPGGSIRELERLIEATIYGDLKTTIAEIDQIDIIEGRTDNKINQIVLGISANSLRTFGIELVDVNIKKFDLPDSNRIAVFDRMISERNRIVATYLAEGEEAANMIRNEAEREKAVIIARARANAEQLKAEGESEYMRIIASAFDTPERADFYEFMRGLDALRITMQGNTTVIMPRDTVLADRLMRIPDVPVHAPVETIEEPPIEEDE